MRLERDQTLGNDDIGHNSVCISVPLWQIRIFGYFFTPNPDIRILSGFLCAGLLLKIKLQ